MELKDKKITVIGLARSGVGAANLLSEMGAKVTVTDRKPASELRAALERLSPSIARALGGHPEEVFRTDLIVVSPGVPLANEQIKEAVERGVQLMGELELAYQIIMGQKYAPSFLAVTGSNGKSTTTTLLDEMMKRAGRKTILGGNIGNALTEEILKELGPPGGRMGSKKGPLIFPSAQEFVVVEVSSFQLESTHMFRPHIATILNVTPDHLDRYHSFAEYGDAKARIFVNQKDTDFLVLNADDPELLRIKNEKLEPRSGKPAILYFSRRSAVEGFYLKDKVMYANSAHFPFPPDFPFLRADEIQIKGVHNLENAMAASAMALLANCPPEAVIESLKEFPGLEHRLEFVRELAGVKYFNDSKGTNVGAVEKSLESFNEPVILIAGGRDKAGDFSALKELVSKRVRGLVLIGEAAEKIKAALSGCADSVIAGDLKEAVRFARDRARTGDTVLLSPACASFDMFRDFEDRGRQFKQIVLELENE